MVSKVIHLKAHCNSCLELVYSKPVTLVIPDLKYLELASNTLFAIYPKSLACTKCEAHKLEYSYTFKHEHKFELDTPTDLHEIDRCKAQIAATYDCNSDIPAKDREIIREGFQKQLGILLKANNVQFPGD